MLYAKVIAIKGPGGDFAVVDKRSIDEYRNRQIRTYRSVVSPFNFFLADRSAVDGERATRNPGTGFVLGARNRPSFPRFRRPTTRNRRGEPLSALRSGIPNSVGHLRRNNDAFACYIMFVYPLQAARLPTRYVLLITVYSLVSLAQNLPVLNERNDCAVSA